MKKIIYLIVFFSVMIVLELGYLSIALNMRMNRLQEQQASMQARMERTETMLHQTVVSVRYFRESRRMKHQPRLLLALND